MHPSRLFSHAFGFETVFESQSSGFSPSLGNIYRLFILQVDTRIWVYMYSYMYPPRRKSLHLGMKFIITSFQMLKYQSPEEIYLLSTQHLISRNQTVLQCDNNLATW